MPETTLIFRAQRNGGFFSMSRQVAQNRQLSYAARGLLAELLSRPDDWKIIPEQLVCDGAGINKVYGLLKELIAAGHIRKIARRSASGQFVEHTYAVFEIPPDDHAAPEPTAPPTPPASGPQQIPLSVEAAPEPQPAAPPPPAAPEPPTPPAVMRTDAPPPVAPEPPLPLPSLDDPRTAELFALYQHSWGLLPTPLHLDEIRDLDSAYGRAWLTDAFRIAAEQRAFRIAYLKGILVRWKRDGKPALAPAASVTPGHASPPTATGQRPKEAPQPTPEQRAHLRAIWGNK